MPTTKFAFTELPARVSGSRRAACHAVCDDLKRMFREREEELCTLLEDAAREQKRLEDAAAGERPTPVGKPARS